MIIDEKKIFRYMDLGFYVIFIPITLLLIPADKFIEDDRLFFAILMIYLAFIHFINRRFNILRFIINRQYLNAVLTAIFLTAVSFAVTRIDVPIISMTETRSAEFIDHRRSMTTWLLFFIDISFSIMLGLVLEIFKQTQDRQEIEAEKTKAEIALYKSQINPHFMFNTLNTLYGLYITGSEKTGEVFIKFTDIIKYMYSNTEKEKISLVDEVKYLKEYIDLHTLRLESQTTINFECEIDDQSATIPPMVLITFVENAFKYGVSSSHPSQIDISVVLKGGKLTFSTSNTVFSRKKGSTPGIGIDNCRKRLELLYPKAYTLECSEDNNIYKTLLKISV